MRKCDNCDSGSYSLDCNTGMETLYCCESEYEHDIQPDQVCQLHQFIDGYENEKNYLLYDENYLGPGYFIVHKQNDQITQFLKIYIMNNSDFPNYGLRAFCVDKRDNLDYKFNNIEFIFRSNEDFENGLFEVFSKFAKGIDENIETIDKFEQGRNNIFMSLDKDIIRFVVSKDMYGGKQHPTDFIDINLGDNYTCLNYDAINSFYNSLVGLCPQTATEQDIEKIIMLKLK